MKRTDEDRAAIRNAVCKTFEEQHGQKEWARSVDEAIFLVGKRAGMEEAARVCVDIGPEVGEFYAAAIRRLMEE